MGAESLEGAITKLSNPSITLSEKLILLHRIQEDISPSALSAPGLKEAFVKGIVQCGFSPSRTLRTSAIRVLRLLLSEGNCLDDLFSLLAKYKAHYFVATSLEKNKSPDEERIQALKLIRVWTHTAPTKIPRALVHPLVAMAEMRQDPFSRVCIEILAELSVRNPRVVAYCGGVRTLMQAITDLEPFSEGVQEALITACLYLLSDTSTRNSIIPNDEIRLIFSPLLDTMETDKDVRKRRWKAAANALVIFLRSWTGIFVLATDPLCLKAIFEALQLDSLELREIILDALFRVFHLQIPKQNDDPFQKGTKRRTEEPELNDMQANEIPSRTLMARHNLLDNYTTALILSSIDAGLIESLMKVVERIKSGEELDEASADSLKTQSGQQEFLITIKATILMGEILDRSNSLLPPTQCAQMQTLPGLLAQAVSFHVDPRIRSIAGTMVSHLHTYSHIKGSGTINFGTLVGANKWKRVKGIDRRLDRIDEVKIKMDKKMEDAVFLNRLKESQVALTKDYTKWNWDIIGELVEGPLHNQTHFDTAVKNKFVQRILWFLRPFNRMFSAMPFKPQNLKFARIACDLLEIMVEHESGVQVLRTNKLVPEIAEMLKEEVDTPEDQKQKDRLLSQENVLKSMSREYFTMIGTMSATPLGLEVLNKTKVFEYLGPMSVMAGRDDLCARIMKSLDYNLPGPSRILLAKSLQAKSKVVRYLATKQMRMLYRARVSEFSDWGIKLLVKQLNDQDKQVCKVALRVLDEAADESACLESLIAKNPNDMLMKAGPEGQQLLMRFLSRSVGYRLLSETDFLVKELEKWRTEGYVQYVTQVETAISEALCKDVWHTGTEASDTDQTVVHLPTHFYGELVRTSDGCSFFKKTNHFEEFHGMLKPGSSATQLQIRGALWVMGHIGKSKKGLRFLEESDTIPLLVSIADHSPKLCVRGTCLYVLGMLSRTRAGARHLESLCWEPQRETYVSVPRDLKSSGLFKIPDWKYEYNWATDCPDKFLKEYPKDDPKGEILMYISNLSNHITTDKAFDNLKRLKTKYPDVFNDPFVKYQTLIMLENYKFRLSARRFIHTLFHDAIWTHEDLEWMTNEPILDFTIIEGGVSSQITPQRPVRQSQTTSPPSANNVPNSSPPAAGNLASSNSAPVPSNNSQNAQARGFVRAQATVSQRATTAISAQPPTPSLLAVSSPGERRVATSSLNPPITAGAGAGAGDSNSDVRLRAGSQFNPPTQDRVDVRERSETNIASTDNPEKSPQDEPEDKPDPKPAAPVKTNPVGRIGLSQVANSPFASNNSPSNAVQRNRPQAPVRNLQARPAQQQ